MDVDSESNAIARLEILEKNFNSLEKQMAIIMKLEEKLSKEHGMETRKMAVRTYLVILCLLFICFITYFAFCYCAC